MRFAAEESQCHDHVTRKLLGLSGHRMYCSGRGVSWTGPNPLQASFEIEFFLSLEEVPSKAILTSLFCYLPKAVVEKYEGM